MTRISTNQFFDTNLYGMQLAGTRMLRAQSELITQKKLQNASDNPSGAVQILRTNQTISEYDQFLKTISNTRSKLEVTDTVLGNFSNAVIRARELTVQMGNGALNASARQGIAKEAEAILLSMQALANSVDPDGARMFAGFKTDTAPIASVNATVGDFPSKIWSYEGDANVRLTSITEARNDFQTTITGDIIFFEREIVRSEITNSGSNPSNMVTIPAVNTSISAGQTVTGLGIPASTTVVSVSGTTITLSGNVPAGSVTAKFTPGPIRDSVFATMQKLADLGNPDYTFDGPGNANLAEAVGDILGRLEKFSNQVFTARADVGARLVELDATENATENSKLSLQKLKSEIEDVDISEAITRFTQQQTILEAARGAYARIQDLSLFKFL